MKLIDSHCHLDFPNFDQDFDQVLARAEEAGVVKFLNPGVDLPSSKKALALAEKFDNIFAAIGFHPSEAQKLSANNLAELEKMLKNPKVVAIGEIGLDFFRNQNSKKMQVEALEKQLNLAEKFAKPVIIHSRNADEEILEVLANFKIQAVFHCFGGDWNFAEKILDRGFLIGLTGIVTFPNAKNTHAVAQKIPLEKLLIETDCPFLAPQKFRGERCEPAFVLEVAVKIAELKNLPVEEITTETTRNAEKLFGI
ncbi:MAG: TatD family hydrolase [Patescibacteria group bacterium]